MRAARWVVVALVGVAGTWLPTPGAGAAAGAPSQGPDFDGDGFGDVAVPVPDDDHSTLTDAGSVHVFYGSASGMTADGDEILHHDDVPGQVNAASEAFGAAVAWGDVDGDAYDDLVVGAPNQGVGSVSVFYGSSAGLLPADAEDLPNSDHDQGSLAGFAVAVGDFDGDGFSDVAYGRPNDKVDEAFNAGSVRIYYGSASGITTTGSQRVVRGGWLDGARVAGDAPISYESLGRSLAVGDFDDDGHDDLVIGVPWDNRVAAFYGGSVHVVPGSAKGLTGDGDKIWHRDLSGVRGSVAPEDRFGTAIATGDFDHDGADDLAVGAPTDDVDGVADAGSVSVLYGTVGEGLTAAGDELWDRSQSDVNGAVDADDRFGGSLVGVNLGNGAPSDLVVGVPQDDVPTLGAGSVHVFYGAADGGLSASDDEIIHRGVDGVAGKPGFADAFGNALFASDFDGAGKPDLVVGVSQDSVGDVTFAGSIHVFGAGSGGVETAGDAIWHRASPGVQSEPEAGDHFGGWLL